jgi:hypothetical protein
LDTSASREGTESATGPDSIRRKRAARLELGRDTLELAEAIAAVQKRLIGLFILRYTKGEAAS